MSSVTSVGATAPLTSSGGTTPTISTSIATNKLLGRSTAGTGVAEEISIGDGLTLSAGTLNTATSVTSVGATAPLTSSGGTTPTISTSIDTNKLLGRSTSGTGVAEEISIGSGLTLSAGTLINTATSVTSVGATLPLTSSGGTTPDISISQASGSTDGFLSSTDWTTFNNKPSNNQIISGYQGLGSEAKSVPIGISFLFPNIGNAIQLTSQRLVLSPVYLSTTTTITGVKWYQSVQGNYTASNYNGVGLYSVSGGVITLIASSTNDNAIWQTFASDTWGNKAFSTPIPNLAAGTYYIAALATIGAPIVTPSILAFQVGTIQFSAVQGFDFTGGRFVVVSAGRTTLPLNLTLSTTTANNTFHWLSLY